MPVPNRMQDLSTLASSNYPTGTEAIGNSLDNYLRSHAAIIRSTNAVSSASIAAASTTNIASSDGESVVITGDAVINSFGTGFPGCIRELRFSGECTITSSSNIFTPASKNMVTGFGDIITVRCTSSGVWGVVAYTGCNAYSRLSFSSIGANVVLASGSPGGVFLRPNGESSSAGQAVVTDNGDFSVSGRFRGNTYAGSATANLILSATGGGAIVLRPNGEDDSTNGAVLTAANGNFEVAGNLISNSDERIKSDWKRMPDDTVEMLASLKRGTYVRTDTGATQVGVGAQSLAAFMPDAVSEGDSGIMSVAYGNAALVGVCEVAARLIDLEAKINGGC